MNQVSAEKRDAIIEISSALLEDMIESRFMSGKWEDDKNLTQWQTWFKVRLDFPSIYANEIQKIIYPGGYVV